MPVESDVRLGRGVVIFHPELVNLYGCQIGDGTKIGSFVEIQKKATIGKNCKISSHSFICEGVEIEDGELVAGCWFDDLVSGEIVGDDGRTGTGKFAGVEFGRAGFGGFDECLY